MTTFFNQGNHLHLSSRLAVFRNQESTCVVLTQGSQLSLSERSS